MNLQRIINPFLTLFNEGINLFFVYEALQKRKKGFIIRCKFIKLYFFQCTITHRDRYRELESHGTANILAIV